MGIFIASIVVLIVVYMSIFEECTEVSEATEDGSITKQKVALVIIGLISLLLGTIT